MNQSNKIVICLVMLLSAAQSLAIADPNDQKNLRLGTPDSRPSSLPNPERLLEQELDQLTLQGRQTHTPPVSSEPRRPVRGRPGSALRIGISRTTAQPSPIMRGTFLPINDGSAMPGTPVQPLTPIQRDTPDAAAVAAAAEALAEWDRGEMPTQAQLDAVRRTGLPPRRTPRTPVSGNTPNTPNSGSTPPQTNQNDNN
jgi:hypothetical protein